MSRTEEEKKKKKNLSSEKKRSAREFMSVSVFEGRVEINASSHDDSHFLRDILQAVGIEVKVNYEGMCG